MATATKLLHLRPKLRPKPTEPPTFARFFSSSTSTSNPNSEPQSNDMEPRVEPPPPSPPRPFSFSSIANPQNSSSKSASLEEIRKNLAQFRSRSASSPPPPPVINGEKPSSSSERISFRDLISKSNNVGVEELNNSQGGTRRPAGTGRLDFEALREALRQRKEKNVNQNAAGGKLNDSLSLSGFKASLRMRPGDSAAETVIGGSGDSSLPASIFGKDKKEGGEDKDKEKMRSEFVKMYSHGELGEKLKMLRPEKTKQQMEKNWFSLEELNERLVKLREIELKESQSRIGGVNFSDIKESLVKLKNTEDEKHKKTMIQRLDILGQLGGTPSFMLHPPKEHLVEKYFHPDNMSSVEKMKLELQRVRDEFKLSQSDCGSARVQVAQLTTKIKHLSTVLHKKDKHSRKGLQAMVQKRKKLLKYLRRTDWDSYCLVLSKLGLRDNPDYKF